MIANAMVRQFGFSDVLGTIDMSGESTRGRLATSIHTNSDPNLPWTLDDEKLSSETKHQIENEVRKLVEGAGSRAMALLKERSHELQHLACVPFTIHAGQLCAAVLCLESKLTSSNCPSTATDWWSTKRLVCRTSGKS